jgi:hypothetical protein
MIGVKRVRGAKALGARADRGLTAVDGLRQDADDGAGLGRQAVEVHQPKPTTQL